MNSEDVTVVITALLVFIAALGVIGSVIFTIFTCVRDDAYDEGWIDGYAAAKKKDRRHK